MCPPRDWEAPYARAVLDEASREFRRHFDLAELRVQNTAKHFSVDHDHIHVYARDATAGSRFDHRERQKWTPVTSIQMMTSAVPETWRSVCSELPQPVAIDHDAIWPCDQRTAGRQLLAS